MTALQNSVRRSDLFRHDSKTFVGEAVGFLQKRAMPQQLSLVSIIVDDYDKAISFYVDMLRFELRHDNWLSEGKRWVVVAPKGAATGLLLAQAADDRQRWAIGKQSGGRVFLFLETDDFARDHLDYVSKGVHFLEKPRDEDYGIVAVFEDLYGNRWDLIQLKLVGS